MDTHKRIVISLGGSIIVPNGIDSDYLRDFVAVIKEYVDKGFTFAVITGGGKICREYLDASKLVANPSNTDLDWIGIASTRLNAELVRVAFGDLAHNFIVTDPDIVPPTTKPVLVGAGWKPGNSSDLAAVHIARSMQAKKVINLSNIDYAYDKDPNQFPDAVKIEQASWAEFHRIVPKEWKPGMNVPFDPIAAQHAERFGLEVAIMNGNNLDNLKNYLNESTFIGTVIR